MARNIEIKASIASVDSLLPRACALAGTEPQIIDQDDSFLLLVGEVSSLDEALTRANGLLGRVRKRRWLLLVGATRIHLDRVEGLPDHMELEVVMKQDQSDADGVATAEALMRDLGLADAPRVAVAYLDLLRAKAPA